jgi:hypothetical protein
MKQEALDLSKPQGTAQGLPVKQIPHQEYPRAVYKHPNAPFYVEEHRNVNHEVVHREVKAAEHRVHVCHSKVEHEQKLTQGWKNEPFIQLAPPDPMDDLYAEVIAEDIARKSGRKKQASEESKPEPKPEVDLVSAQKFLLSRGYTCDKPEGATRFMAGLTSTELTGFLKELGDFVAKESSGE